MKEWMNGTEMGMGLVEVEVKLWKHNNEERLFISF